MLKNILLVLQSCLCTAGYAADLDPKMDGIEASISLQQEVISDELPSTILEAIISGTCKTKSTIPLEDIKRFFEQQLHKSTIENKMRGMFI